MGKEFKYRVGHLPKPALIATIVYAAIPFVFLILFMWVFSLIGHQS